MTRPPIAPRGEVITGIMPQPIIVYTKAQSQTHFLTLVDTPMSYKDYAGYPCVVNSAENALEFTRTFQANDTSPVLTLDQDSTGVNLLLTHATQPEVRWVEEDQTDPAGRYRWSVASDILSLRRKGAAGASWDASAVNLIHIYGGAATTRVDIVTAELVVGSADAGGLRFGYSAAYIRANTSGNLYLQSRYGSGVKTVATLAGHTSIAANAYFLLNDAHLGGSLKCDNYGITTMADPTAAQDAATKNYVDTSGSGGGLNGLAILVYLGI